MCNYKNQQYSVRTMHYYDLAKLYEISQAKRGHNNTTQLTNYFQHISSSHYAIAISDQSKEGVIEMMSYKIIKCI